tara:strand:+ start:455 stop:763 length:309 start_codon:yes stop_codon:yes gene_type:complete
MDTNEPIYNIDDEIIRLSTQNFTMNIELEEVEFNNKMFKLQNDILQDDIRKLETDNFILKSKLNSLNKYINELYIKNLVINKIIENTFNKYNELLKIIYKNK